MNVEVVADQNGNIVVLNDYRQQQSKFRRASLKRGSQAGELTPEVEKNIQNNLTAVRKTLKLRVENGAVKLEILKV